MLTLTQTAVFTRRFIVSIVVLSILSLVGFIVYKIWYANYLASLPKPVEKPTITWGALPYPEWPSSSATATNFTYTIDTVSGLLSKENLESITKVYFMPKGILTLLSSQKGDELASKFGIFNKPEILSEIKYRYGGVDRTLTADIDTGNFLYAKEATVAAKLAVSPIDSDTEKITRDFKNFLESQGLMKYTLQNGSTKIIFLSLSGNQFVPTESVTEAQAFQISIWPQGIDGKSMITGSVDRSQIVAIVVKSADSLENYLSLNYTFWPIDTSTFSTYPLKTSDQAFEDLKGGKGVILLEPGKAQVSITSVRLAYYQTEKYTPYLEPIFIFEGPSFVGYAAAIADQYLTATR